MKQVIRIIFYVVACIVSVTGCSKDEAEDTPKEGISIRVEAPLINGWGNEENMGTRSRGINTVRQEGEDGLDMEADFRYDCEGTAGNKATTRWENIDGNTTFRIVAYKCSAASEISTANYAGYGDYKLLANNTVQTTTDLIIPQGTYTFICYSYGNANDMTAFNSSSTSVSVSNGQNFMTCVKPGVTINNAGSTYTLDNIVFKHHCARYRILAKAQAGRMGNITACTGSVTLPNNSATYTFTNGVFKVQAATGAANVSWSSPNAMSVYSNYTYLLPQGSVSITVKLNPTIGGKAFTNKSTTLSGLTFAANKTYRSDVSFTTTQGYITKGAFWANGNLYYKNNSYSIYPQMSTYSGVANGGDYWDWNSHLPYPTTTSRTTWDDNYDPCKKVLPTNTWRSPTSQEATKLIQDGTWKEATLDGVLGMYCDNLVFLPYAGLVNFSASPPAYRDKGSRGLYQFKITQWGKYMNINISLNIINGSNHNDHCMSIRCVRNI